MVLPVPPADRSLSQLLATKFRPPVTPPMSPKFTQELAPADFMLPCLPGSSGTRSKYR